MFNSFFSSSFEHQHQSDDNVLRANGLIPSSREERIAAFNQIARELKTDTQSVKSTWNYIGKTVPSTNKNLKHLSPIIIPELNIGITHRNRALYGRIVSETWQINSAMVLIEDHLAQDIVSLAVYGLHDASYMKLDRYLVVIEPHYKIRQDGSPGIRVDDPNDIIFDIQFDAKTNRSSSNDIGSGKKNDFDMAVELRLQHIFEANPDLGIDNVFRKVTSEGYKTTKQQVRAAKKYIQDGNHGQDQSDIKKSELPSSQTIISNRRPENHRMLTDASLLALRANGNKAFQQGDYEHAINCFTAAISGANPKSSVTENDLDLNPDSVALWQLFGNRSAAYFQLGKLDEALLDALSSNSCAPKEELKPILRCIETMASLGMKEEVMKLVEEATNLFPEHNDVLEQKKQQVQPKQILQVGPDKTYQSIFNALDDAEEDAEIQIDPGVYDEPTLVLTKSVTLCGSKSVSMAATHLDESSIGSKNLWPVIRVTDEQSTIICNTNSSTRPIRIIGLKLICRGRLQNCYHALDIRSGLVVVRHTILTSGSGPVVAVQSGPLEPVLPFLGRKITQCAQPSQLIMHGCKVVDGAQGGVLVADSTKATLRQVHITGNSACGLELREGASAHMETCQMYNNGRQGILVWMKSGTLSAKHCRIHSHLKESGVNVSDGEACFESCEFYGNVGAGIASQQLGNISLNNCRIYDNLEGVLIQDTGSGCVKKCEVFRNRANGIFVGFDHQGIAEIAGNSVYENMSFGILIGNAGNGRVRKMDNMERDNKGLPPQIPKIIGQKFAPSQKHHQTLIKNRASIEKTMRDHPPSGEILDTLIQQQGFPTELLFRVSENFANNCLSCGKSPSDSQMKFPHCSRCQEAIYCSAVCQRNDWPRHKAVCRRKDIKYPQFIDSNKSVKQMN